MRLALVGPAYPLRGGIAHYNASLFQALEAAGHRVRLYGMSRQYPGLLFPGKRQEDLSDDPIEARSEAVVDSIGPVTWAQTADKIRRFAPDAAVFQWWHPFFAPSFGTIARLCRRRGIAPVFICHNVRPHEATQLDDALLRYAYSATDRFLVHAKEEQARLTLALRGRSHRVEVAPHPVYDVFEPTTLTRDEARAQLGLTAPLQILFFGYVRRYKGLDILLEALADIDLEFELTVAGECYEDAEVYRRQIESLGLSNRVQFLDRYVSNEEVPVLFRATDVCVLPYRHATQSGIVQVAYALDTPVIVSRVGGIPEVVEDGVSGLLVPAEDSGALRSAVRRYFREQLRDALVAGVQKKRSELGWNRIVDALQALVS